MRTPCPGPHPRTVTGVVYAHARSSISGVLAEFQLFLIMVLPQEKQVKWHSVDCGVKLRRGLHIPSSFWLGLS
eukprot:scaffold19841_cov13-Tisochrysis_lutea.AAC.1